MRTTAATQEAWAVRGPPARANFAEIPRPMLWLVAAAVAFGAICRVSQYAAATSLWHDEAYVALNVIHHSFAGLLGPLQWNESAPPGFLIVEKAVVCTLGRSEYALRLIPLLAGVAGLVVFAALALEVCGSGYAWLWAVVLMAGSDKLIAQANELKHFTLDALLSAGLLYLALCAGRTSGRTRVLIAWGALGGAAAWLSFASALVFCGTSLVLLSYALGRWRWSARAAYLLANLIAAGAMAALAGPIRAQMSGALLNFWQQGFPDTSGPGWLLWWLARSELGLFNYFYQPLGIVLIALAPVGAARLWRSGRRLELMLLWMPVAISLAAAFAHRWPFGGNQHMVFAAPAVLITVGEGAEAVRARLLALAPLPAAAFVVLLMTAGLSEATWRIASPRLRHEVRPVLEFADRHRQPEDRFLVTCRPEVDFYTGGELLRYPPAGDPSDLFGLTHEWSSQACFQRPPCCSISR